MPTPDMPSWLANEISEAIDELPEAEAAWARGIVARGEHTVERWPCRGIQAWAVDVGPLELLTCAPDHTPNPGRTVA
ncbi:hypothetical protein [Streptomyces sp. MUM 178J]|uniref:hypothetical protein n=1 Tax=Streptomyces sp. MUM 178J TaxID=2791991 RepID=UPI001F03B5CF|nr:hypothetical protein [Streptomyces sp. MUM 178J]WRQ80293.1 hypothetical protein I3F59_013550 [Streptomyces sp. MUM 178J]